MITQWQEQVLVTPQGQILVTLQEQVLVILQEQVLAILREEAANPSLSFFRQFSSYRLFHAS